MNIAGKDFNDKESSLSGQWMREIEKEAMRELKRIMRLSTFDYLGTDDDPQILLIRNLVLRSLGSIEKSVSDIINGLDKEYYNSYGSSDVQKFKRIKSR